MCACDKTVTDFYSLKPVWTKYWREILGIGYEYFGKPWKTWAFLEWPNAWELSP
jgi:hypothetical protein